jgi:hypothetical protein
MTNGAGSTKAATDTLHTRRIHERELTLHTGIPGLLRGSYWATGRLHNENQFSEASPAARGQSGTIIIVRRATRKNLVNDA